MLRQGGSEGIGYGCSHTLLSHNIAKIFILSVSKDVIDGAINAVKEEMGEAAAKKIVWLQCDISNWSKVVETANVILKQTDRLDILINNAARGIMTYQLTDYGVDRHVSSFSPWIQTYALSLTLMTDGHEPYGPCHPYLPPLTSHEIHCKQR